MHLLTPESGILLLLLALLGIMFQFDTVVEDWKARKSKKEGDDSDKKSPPSGHRWRV